MTDININKAISDYIGASEDYINDLNSIYSANKKIGLHDRDNLELRVKWVGHLRTVVSRRCPLNKLGTPVVSDLDILEASSRELAEAFLMTVGKWKKK
jgi:hypothetical protein